VPQTTDDVVFNNTSDFNCSIDNVGTWSGGTFTISSGYNGTITKSVAIVCGNFSIADGTFTDGSTAFTCADFAISGGTFTATSGTWTLTGSFTKTNSPAFTANGGTIACTGSGLQIIDAPSVTFNLFTINATGTVAFQANTTAPLGANPTTSATEIAVVGTATVSGTWTATGSVNINAFSGTISGALTAIAITNGDFSGGFSIPSTLAVSITMTGATDRSLSVGTTIGSFTRLGSGTGRLLVDGSGNHGNFTDNAAIAAHGLRFASFLTRTFTQFNVSGAPGAVVTVDSTLGGFPATLTKTGGDVSCDYLSLKDITVDASPVWYAGSHSTNGGGNTNWVFSDPVAASTVGAGVAKRRRRHRG
jgi:hypothetical protein